MGGHVGSWGRLFVNNKARNHCWLCVGGTKNCEIVLETFGLHLASAGQSKPPSLVVVGRVLFCFCLFFLPKQTGILSNGGEGQCLKSSSLFESLSLRYANPASVGVFTRRALGE